MTTPVPRRRLLAARALTPAFAAVALLLAAAFGGLGLTVARDTTYVVVGVGVPVVLLLSCLLAGLPLRDAAGVTLLSAGLFAAALAFGVAMVLHWLGQDFGSTALMFSGLCWLGALVAAMLVASVGHAIHGNEDGYGGAL